MVALAARRQHTDVISASIPLTISKNCIMGIDHHKNHRKRKVQNGWGSFDGSLHNLPGSLPNSPANALNSSSSRELRKIPSFTSKDACSCGDLDVGQERHSIQQAFQLYRCALQKYPLRTKSITSSVMAGLGEIIGQTIRNRSTKNLSLWRILAFMLYSGVVTGPCIHHLYQILEKIAPSGQSKAIYVKLLIDRFIFTPPFLFISFVSLNILSGLPRTEAIKAAKGAYVNALMMNWRVWTVAQYVNFKYVPPQFRVLFGNIVALWWNAYLSLTAIKK